MAGIQITNNSKTCELCPLDEHCILCSRFLPSSGASRSAALRSEKLKRGDTLFTAGQPFKQLYVIRSGSIKTSIIGREGESQITGFHLPGALLGLDGVAGGEYAHCAQALENCTLCSISFAEFSAHLASKPQYLQQLLRRVSLDIKRGNKTVFMLGRCNAQQRMARFLLELSECYQRAGLASDRLSLTMSRTDIASYLGLASETACRVLQRFHASGLVHVERRDIQLKNIAQLRAVANDVAASPELVDLAS